MESWLSKKKSHDSKTNTLVLISTAVCVRMQGVYFCNVNFYLVPVCECVSERERERERERITL